MHKGSAVTFVRSPAVAGTFYPAEPDALRRQLAHFMSDAGNGPPAATPTPPKAIIGPHAGYVYSGPVAARAYARLAAAREHISRVVLIGPSHYVAFQGIAVDTADAWSLPSGTVALDSEAIALLRAMPMIGTLDAAYAKEHALEVHVPFLQHVLGNDFRLVPLVAGEAPAEAVAAVFDALWGGPETLFVISTDLSHYLDYAACQEIDQRTAEAIERFDADALTPTGACGCVPTRGLLLAARQRGMAIERLDLRNSGDTAGPRDRVVGYGAWALYESDTAATADEEHAAVEAIGPVLLQIARGAIEVGFNSGRPPEIIVNTELPPLLAAHGAAFVTLKRNGQLRGCIGSPVAWRPLVQDVAHHAFNAAFKDPRFPPLDLLEQHALELSVSVLTPPAAMQFASEADLLQQLRPGIDGLIIEDTGRRALFLPSVWEEIRDPRMFLSHLRLKAGMAADDFSPSFTAQRFRSIEVKGRMLDGNPGGAASPLASAGDHVRWSPFDSLRRQSNAN